MSEVFKSRWGFHPCSKEVDKKLRKLNAAYQRALSYKAAWNRWDAKKPQNRILYQKIYDNKGRICGRRPILDALNEPLKYSEPKICPVFCRKVTKKVYYDSSGLWVKDGIERYFIEIQDHGIPALAKQSRTPVASPELVKPLNLTIEQIDLLLSNLI
jgi:hypothetical protein